MDFEDGEWWLNPDEVDFLEQWYGKSNYVIPVYPLFITASSVESQP